MSTYYCSRMDPHATIEARDACDHLREEKVEFRPCRLVADWCRTHQRARTAACIDPGDLGYRVLRSAVGVSDAVAIIMALRISGLSIQEIS